MERTRRLKDKWNDVAVKIYEKLGVLKINTDDIFISNMLVGAIVDNKPLTDNEIKTIECIIRGKEFKHDLL